MADPLSITTFLQTAPITPEGASALVDRWEGQVSSRVLIGNQWLRRERPDVVLRAELDDVEACLRADYGQLALHGRRGQRGAWGAYLARSIHDSLLSGLVDDGLSAEGLRRLGAALGARDAGVAGNCAGDEAGEALANRLASSRVLWLARGLGDDEAAWEALAGDERSSGALLISVMLGRPGLVRRAILEGNDRLASAACWCELDEDVEEAALERAIHSPWANGGWDPVAGLIAQPRTGHEVREAAWAWLEAHPTGNSFNNRSGLWPILRETREGLTREEIPEVIDLYTRALRTSTKTTFNARARAVSLVTIDGLSRNPHLSDDQAKRVRSAALGHYDWERVRRNPTLRRAVRVLDDLLGGPDELEARQSWIFIGTGGESIEGLGGVEAARWVLLSERVARNQYSTLDQALRAL